jgi:hypothetical protein
MISTRVAMRRSNLLFAGLLLATLACAHPEQIAPGSRDGGALPPEVQAFVERREGCDHFRGEEPYDEERVAYITHQLDQLCPGTDAELARLKREYAQAPEVMEVLLRFEERVE